jgi:hypothetical protein
MRSPFQGMVCVILLIEQGSYFDMVVRKWDGHTRYATLISKQGEIRERGSPVRSGKDFDAVIGYGAAYVVAKFAGT